MKEYLLQESIRFGTYHVKLDRVLVFVNGTDWKAAQMFTLAHEFAHIFYGSSAAFDLRRLLPANEPLEITCNKAAAEFLVPESKLRELWKSISNSQEPFQRIARHFKVSRLVGARRALDLSLISRDEYFDFYSEFQQDERYKSSKKKGGGDFRLNQNLRLGRRFATAVVIAAREGKLLYSEAYRLTDLYGKTFENYSRDSLGIGGVD